jgi:NADPH2:quinone reductase
MKAIRVHQFGGPDVMRLEEVPDPTPGPGEIVVRVAAAGVNPVDTYIRSGVYAARPSLPYTPGCDAGGTVEAVGDGVQEFKPGDRVYVGGTSAGRYLGAYAERLACAVAQAHPLVDGVSFGDGAALGVPFTTAYRALFHRAQARPGETVLVHGGSGGVGTAAIQLARARGLTVIATAGTAEGMALVRDLGAHHVVSHREAGYLDRIRALTGGRGVDVIVEMLANVNLDHDLALLANRGRVAIVGNRGRIEIDPRQAMSKDAAIVGMALANTTPDELREIHAAIVAGLANRTLRPIVRQQLPLAEAPRAHELVLQPGAYGKIVLVP